MPKPTRTRPLSAAQVHDYVRKAEEFAESAVSELSAERFISATSLAIHAAINSADAVCGARIGQARRLANGTMRWFQCSKRLEPMA